MTYPSPHVYIYLVSASPPLHDARSTGTFFALAGGQECWAHRPKESLIITENECLTIHVLSKMEIPIFLSSKTVPLSPWFWDPFEIV